VISLNLWNCAVKTKSLRLQTGSSGGHLQWKWIKTFPLLLAA
jgi:hypothetical protein